jgi:hypothetical protein
MVFLDAERPHGTREYRLINSIKNTLVEGIRLVSYNIKFVLLLWGINTASAFILTVPVYYILADNLTYSSIGAAMNDGFDFTWFIQFEKIYETNLGELPLMIYGTVAIYVLVQTFFLGGLVSVFNFPNKNHMVDFFYGGVKYWYRFTKVTLVSIFFFAIAFKINDFLGDWIMWGFEDTESNMAEFFLRAFRYLILIFLIALITLIADYSKVALGITDRHRVISEIYNTMIFIKMSFSKIFLIFLIVALIGALGAVVYGYIDLVIPRSPYYFLILSFILQQMLIIFRLLVRMLFCSTEVTLYKDLSAEIITKS